MKLDRNITKPRRGKYALIKLRQSRLTPELCCGPSEIMVETEAIDFGCDGEDFFVIRLKDKYAPDALRAYARAASADDIEYAKEIDQLALNAENHPNKKRPD